MWFPVSFVAIDDVAQVAVDIDLANQELVPVDDDPAVDMGRAPGIPARIDAEEGRHLY